MTLEERLAALGFALVKILGPNEPRDRELERALGEQRIAHSWLVFKRGIAPVAGGQQKHTLLRLNSRAQVRLLVGWLEDRPLGG